MTRKLLVGGIVAGALAVTAGTAFALSSADQPSPSATTSTTTPTSTSTSPSSSAPTSTSSSTSLAAPGTSSAPTSTSSTTPASSSTTPAPGDLSADDAARVVRERMGGTVHEVEREVEHGRLEWKVEITARDGITYDVRLDAATGDVTRIDQDDDRGGDRDDDRGGDHGGDRDDD